MEFNRNCSGTKRKRDESHSQVEAGNYGKIVAIDDLQVVKSEEFVDNDGEACFCSYSFKLDSVTFVGVERFQHLQKCGIKEIQNLPN